MTLRTRIRRTRPYQIRHGEPRPNNSTELPERNRNPTIHDDERPIMSPTLLDTIETAYPLHERPGVSRTFKASGMRFSATAYEAIGFGHVSVMNATGIFGLMKMETLILNPFFADAPLLSLDRIHAFGREVLVAEMYDSLLGSSFCFDGLKDVAALCPSEPKKQGYWYDDLIVAPGLNLKGKRADAARFDVASEAFLLTYLAEALEADPCDEAEKKRKASAYSEGLLKHGGPATDPVKKAMGEEWTAALFREVLFGNHLPSSSTR